MRLVADLPGPTSGRRQFSFQSSGELVALKGGEKATRTTGVI